MKELLIYTAVFLLLGLFPGSFFAGYALSKKRHVSAFLFIMLVTLAFFSMYIILRLSGVSWQSEEGDMLLICLGVLWYGLVVFQTLRWSDTPGWIAIRALSFLPFFPIVVLFSLSFTGFISMVIRKLC